MIITLTCTKPHFFKFQPQRKSPLQLEPLQLVQVGTATVYAILFIPSILCSAGSNIFCCNSGDCDIDLNVHEVKFEEET